MWLSSASGATGYPSISGMPRTLEKITPKGDFHL